MKIIKNIWNKWLENHYNNENLAYCGVFGIILVVFIVTANIII